MATIPESHPTLCDVLVIGSGAAGLTAAITAATAGLRVIVAEKASLVGGATAWSGGWVWLPGTSEADRINGSGDGNRAKTYLKQSIGSGFDNKRIDAFVENSRQLDAFLKKHTSVRFLPDTSLPDYQSDLAGAATGGRSRVIAPYDGRKLGSDIHRLRAPLPVLTLAGLMPAAGLEMRHFFNATRSLASLMYVGKRLLQHVVEFWKVGRNLTLTNGNALAGGLFEAALNHDVQVLTNTAAQSLTFEDGKVTGATLTTDSGVFPVRATHAVILACGGFASHEPMRRQYYRHTSNGRGHWTLAPSETTGDGVQLALAVGAQITSYGDGNGAWVPVSLVPGTDGTERPFPHFADRAKPGLFAVFENGKRFTNEAAPYFDFMQGLFKATPSLGEATAWLICDHRFQRKYGLGFSKPSPFPLGRYLRTGYLKQAPTLGALAAACGIDRTAFCQTVAAYHENAANGKDPVFGRGQAAINRAQGDPTVTPNPCVAPVTKPPFYAVKIHPGCLGTFAGLKTDEQARVLGDNETPISGLFACGSDMSSIMAGRYPAGGISLGPALVFGNIAGRIAAKNPAKHSQDQEHPEQRWSLQ
ncbi:FAD-dependent oxidoreductase [Pseudohalocynthiibacter aestuariivivens]|uniref:FAD-dependent oxidoreductase n=1 Tax=Pseudohalocynthiibacter aestuariivivens TaxID=1591409 RepID=A0ABV5JCQ6_9RHOB|nr:FAD-dependent oxidoreductase [Pseudohalocynthiibacter aestuariivivens]MBS9717264.1 FAD-dependent oxidoreductase [Pseudohalocynthiibacter aestuariivivens]